MLQAFTAAWCPTATENRTTCNSTVCQSINYLGTGSECKLQWSDQLNTVLTDWGWAANNVLYLLTLSITCCRSVDGVWCSTLVNSFSNMMIWNDVKTANIPAKSWDNSSIKSCSTKYFSTAVRMFTLRHSLPAFKMNTQILA